MRGGGFTYSTIKEVSLGCAGSAAVIVYPTISSGKVQVQLPAGLEKAVVKVVNALGQVMAMDVSGNRSRTLDLSKLVSGSYMIGVLSNGNVTDQVKIVLQH
jgi:hypothetical protein